MTWHYMVFRLEKNIQNESCAHNTLNLPLPLLVCNCIPILLLLRDYVTCSFFVQQTQQQSTVKWIKSKYAKGVKYCKCFGFRDFLFVYDSECLYSLLICPIPKHFLLLLTLSFLLIPKLLVIRNYHILSYKSYYKYYDHDDLMRFLFLRNV